MIKLLFVDDEPNVLDGLKRSLRSQTIDFEFEGVTSAKEVLKRVQETEFDVIVSDIRMPQMNGLELLAELKNNLKTRHIPVIMLTGCAEKELKSKAIELGAYDFVNKPADPQELASRLNNAFGMKSYEDQLREQNIILERQLIQAQKMELIGILASEVAHDLNNILQCISGHAELAASYTDNIDQIRKHTQQARESGLHAINLVQQILQLGRGLHSKSKLPNLADMIDESLSLMSIMIPEGVRLVWSKPLIDGCVNSDSTQIYQILANLCKNAVHAMNGAGTLTIALDRVPAIPEFHKNPGISDQGPYYRVEVSDRGPGIEASILDNIFKPFYTAKPAGKGTGIGLAVVARIVKNIGGTIKVESTIGEGTTFIIYLPCVPCPDEEYHQ